MASEKPGRRSRTSSPPSINIWRRASSQVTKSSSFWPVTASCAESERRPRVITCRSTLTSRLKKLSAFKASQFTVFYDACREDPFPGRGLKGNTLTDVTARILTLTPTRLPESRTEPPTSVIFYACQIGERAYENAKLQHGVFTYYILRGLQELAARPDGGVDAGWPDT